MTYNQYYNILSFTILFLTSKSKTHSTDYYLEKTERFLGNIEIVDVVYNKDYLSKWKCKDKRVHSILNYFTDLKNNGVSAKNIIKYYSKNIKNIDKIPNIQIKGLHPLLYDLISEHMKDEEEFILKLKRRTILNKVI